MDEHLSRAELARQVLENPVFAEAMDAMKSAFLDRWLSTKDLDTDERERLWKYRKFLDLFEQTLRGYIDRGKPADLIDRP